MDIQFYKTVELKFISIDNHLFLIDSPHFPPVPQAQRIYHKPPTMKKVNIYASNIQEFGLDDQHLNICIVECIKHQLLRLNILNNDNPEKQVKALNCQEFEFPRGVYCEEMESAVELYNEYNSCFCQCCLLYEHLKNITKQEVKESYLDTDTSIFDLFKHQFLY